MDLFKVCESGLAPSTRRKGQYKQVPMPAHDRAVVDAALAILERYVTASKHQTLDSPEAMKKYLRLLLGHERREIFVVLFFSANNGLIACESMFTGSTTSVTVYPREIVTKVLEHNAANVVLCHNHPSGMVDPSVQDIALTQRVQAALHLIDVQVLDHVIVSANATLSMKERGCM